MSQGVIPLSAAGSGAAVRSKINAALQRLQTKGSGTARPSDIAAYEDWVDTDTPGAGVVTWYVWDGTADIPLATYNTSTHAVDWLGTINGLTPSAPTAVGVNRLINEDFAIDQRNEGSSKTFTAAAAVAYCVDRWYASCTGANLTGQRVAGTSPNQYAYKFTGAASVTGVLLGQRIEAANIADLVSADVVVSLKIKSSSLTSLGWTAYYAGSTDNFSSKTSIASGTISGISSTLATKSFTLNLGANAGTGIAIEFTGGALLATHTLQIESVQLESGTTATALERRPFADRLLNCQRYYQKSYSPGVALATATALGLRQLGTNGTGATNGCGFGFIQPMRAAPTLSFWDASGNASQTARYTSGSYVANSGATATVSIGATGVVMTSADALGGTLFVHYAAAAEI